MPRFPVGEMFPVPDIGWKGRLYIRLQEENGLRGSGVGAPADELAPPFGAAPCRFKKDKAHEAAQEQGPKDSFQFTVTPPFF